MPGGPALAAEPPHDPVRVFYPAGDCETGVLEIELWNRIVEEWRPHPAHARIMADTCQTEDAGDLLNEIRVRCADPANPARASEWLTGVQVYEPADAPGCGPPHLGVAPRRSPLVTLTEPADGEPVRSAHRDVDVAGRVRLVHDVVVLVDTSFGAADLRALTRILSEHFLADADRLAGLRMAWIGFETAPNAAIRAPVAPPVLSDDPARMRDALERLGDGSSPAGAHGFGAALDAALAPLRDAAGSGDRRTILALVDARSGHPFGDEAGRDPAHRRDVLGAVQRIVEEGVGLEILAIGRRERDLAELADQVRERIVAGGAGGGVEALPEVGAVAAALPSVPIVTIREVRVENLTAGGVAEPLEWDLAGRFEGRIPMESGRNLLRVRALPSRGHDIVADFEREFDATALRERLRAEERARMRRERAADPVGTVTIDVEDR